MFPCLRFVLNTQTLYLVTGSVNAHIGGYILTELTKIPNQEDLEYIRKLIWEVFDHLDYSQYVEKLCWDCPDTLIPAVYFGKAPKELWQTFHDIINQMKNILYTKWKKEIKE